MTSNFEKIKEFHDKFGLPNNENPELIYTDLRLGLIEEEFNELKEAIDEMDQEMLVYGYNSEQAKNKMADVAKELTDLAYVVYGAATVWGIDLNKCFEEVHSSNMSKLGENGKPIYREDGKVLKGPNYRPANLKKVLYDE
jgi:predicted HAD superfamily Cof-like phosphohydrolase